MPDFLPRKEIDLLSWTRNLSQKLSEDPLVYQLTVEQAAEYAELQQRYAQAYQRAVDPHTRGLVTVAQKNFARVPLVAMTRRIAKTLNGVGGISEDQRLILGFAPRKGRGMPIAPPESAPFVVVDSVRARTVTITLRNEEEGSRRGRPRSAAGALIYSHVGEEPPTQKGQWRLHAQTTKMRVELTFPQEVPSGATVWFTAHWYSPRAERGMESKPIRTNLPGGFAVPEANLMRRAA